MVQLRNTIRALRPLRAVKRVPGLSVLVQWVLQVLPKMGDIVLLCAFVFTVFGVVGVALFKGALHNRCALPGYDRLDRYAPAVPDQAAFDTGVACKAGSGADQCITLGTPEGSTCAYFEANPDFGLTSFDSILVAMVALVEAMTFDAWADPMYDLMTAVSPNAWIYFVLIVLLGGFFVVNLFLPVIFLEYESARESVAVTLGREASPIEIDSRPPQAQRAWGF